jgi:hypothetical protein
VCFGLAIMFAHAGDTLALGDKLSRGREMKASESIAVIAWLAALRAQASSQAYWQEM